MSEAKKPWCDGPYELISASKAGEKPGETLSGAQQLAKEMILVHNIIIRGINCVHRQAVRVATEGTDQDKLDFANFAYQWSRALQQHHDLEETLLFPRMSEAAGNPTLLDGPKEEHREFDAGLKRYEEYVKSVMEGRQELDGEQLKGIVDEVMPVIHRHLVHEIDTLLGLEKYGDEVDWIKILQEVAGASARQDMMQSWYRTDVFPLMLHLHDKSFEDGTFGVFPPMPWIILRAMQWLFFGTRASWWGFAGCDANSMPQELPFASCQPHLTQPGSEAVSI